MSIFAITAALAALAGLNRTCPDCGKEQIVPREEKHATVPCKFCGAAMPPPNPQQTDE